MQPLKLETPRISLIIPAYNEEELLPRLLDSIDAARATYGGTVEVIVADNASTDGTAELARRRGCRVVAVEKRAIAAARKSSDWEKATLSPCRCSPQQTSSSRNPSGSLPR